jgi:hypothetical protein
VNGQIEHVIQVVDGFERKNLAFRQAQSAGVLHDRSPRQETQHRRTMLLADFSQTAVARKNINAGRSECGAARGVFSRRTAAVIARALPIGLPNTRPVAAPLISFPLIRGTAA